ncbi:uncharacterized protein [Argopecten irradians]|uniref:uncharacterized protein n=1 Tax=Argopecten irradians TaxID=31199 RepID=UPI0037128069
MKRLREEEARKEEIQKNLMRQKEEDERQKEDRKEEQEKTVKRLREEEARKEERQKNLMRQKEEDERRKENRKEEQEKTVKRLREEETETKDRDELSDGNFIRKPTKPTRPYNKKLKVTNVRRRSWLPKTSAKDLGLDLTDSDTEDEIETPEIILEDIDNDLEMVPLEDNGQDRQHDDTSEQDNSGKDKDCDNGNTMRKRSKMKRTIYQSD